MTEGVSYNMTEEERDTMDDAFRNQQANSGEPALLGIQVHRVPWWLQIIYMIGVVAALAWVIMKAVGKLTERDRSKEEEIAKKQELKAGKKDKVKQRSW